MSDRSQVKGGRMNFSNDQAEEIKDSKSDPEPPSALSAKRRKSLSVLYRSIASLKLNPKNPRIHNRAQRRRLAASIRKYGFCVPILIDSQGNVIAGHGRIEACIMLGITQVPTICLDHMTEAEVRAFMLADNRLTEMGEWDDRLLGQVFVEILELDPSFDLELSGFDMGEIDLSIESAAQNSKADDVAGEFARHNSGQPPRRPLDTARPSTPLRQLAEGSCCARASLLGECKGERDNR